MHVYVIYRTYNMYIERSQTHVKLVLLLYQPPNSCDHMCLTLCSATKFFIINASSLTDLLFTAHRM